MIWTGDNGQLFGWDESTWLWLDQVGILVGNIMIVFTVLAGVTAWLKRDSIRSWLRFNRFPVSGEKVTEEDRWDALIFTVSRQIVPRWVLQTRTPRAVGLLATKESLPDAEALASHAREDLRLKDVLGPRLLNDADDPAQTHEETRRLIRRLRKEGYQRIAVDVTGGKTPMSLGAFMAAQEEGCDTIYVSSKYDPGLKKPDMRTASIRQMTYSSDS